MRKGTIFVIILFVISVAVAGVSWYVRTNRDQGSYPTITMENRTIEVSVAADDSAILEGIIANDAEDGDLTGSLIVEGMSRFITKGKRSVQIGVVDSTNKVTEVTRDIIYTDYESPKFSLDAPLIFPVGTTKLDGMIQAEDMIDGDITGKIRMKTDATDLGEREGSFRVTFSCSNSLGDSSELPVTIIYDNNYADSSFPKIRLTDYLIYMKQDEWINLWDLVESLTAEKHTFEKITEDGNDILRIPGTKPAEDKDEDEADEDGEKVDDPNVVEFDDFDIEYGTLNYNVPGVYEVYFTYTDSQDRTGRTCLVVVVEEAE